jgi:hypothetical protein
MYHKVHDVVFVVIPGGLGVPKSLSSLVEMFNRYSMRGTKKFSKKL